MACMPLRSVEVEKTAMPLALTATVPMAAPLSLKATVPLGATAPPPDMATVAVKVTGTPTEAGFVSEVRLVVVSSLTTCETTLDGLVGSLGRWRLSPLYEAVMACEPTVSDGMLKVAMPDLRGTEVWRFVK